MYHTMNIDLAAALIAHGVGLADVRTDDGTIISFVFPDHWGPGFEHRTEVTARLFAAGDLPVDALAITQRLRELRVAIRRAQDQYRKDAREKAGLQS